MGKPFPRLSRAPIREGLIDFRVIQGQNHSKDDFEGLIEELSKRYATVEPIKSFEGMFEFGPEGVKTHSSVDENFGKRLASSDGRIVVQIQSTGLTVSFLEPYTSWDALLSEFKTIWNSYSHKLKPKSIARIAARYINEFKVEREGKDLKALLSMPPRMPIAHSFGVLSDLIRQELFEESSQSTVLLTQVVNVQGTHWSVMIDIDAIRQKDYLIGEQLIWDDLERLRSFKNHVFFGLVKKQAIDMFR